LKLHIFSCDNGLISVISFHLHLCGTQCRS